MIGFNTPCTFTQFGTTGNYRAIAILHTFQFTFARALGFSDFTSRNLAMDLSQSHCNFKSHMKSSFHNLIPVLPLFCNCQFRRLDSIQFPAHIQAGWQLKLDSITATLYCRTLPYNHFARTPRKTQSLLLKRSVY
jgi:hypothetical protein